MKVSFLDKLDEKRLGLLFVIPALVLMAVVAAYPVFKAFWLSLHRYNVKVPDDYAFIGFENYTRILGSAHWWDATKTTFIFAFASVTVEFALGLCMALVMNKGLGKATGLVRVAVLIPWATITIVTALAWKWIFTPTSTLTWMKTVMGWFVEESCMLCGTWSSMFAMVFADAWKTAPFIALLLLAGLQSIDAEMYEAADVDGASRWRQFVSITLPSLKPAILVALLFRSLDALRMFDLAYVMTNGANKTETVSMLAYDVMIKRLDIGLGSAMSVLVFVLVLGVAFLFVRFLGATPEGADEPIKKTRKQKRLEANVVGAGVQG
ncbi:MAG: carbohydrate transporter rane protein 1, family [Thermoleophilia bacterium]|nr:carbohydrate transporter rane protein 1, family [Thermoleophilia bacterium]MCZ4497013.1 carbohydrate transporter rane protein 1, family [Thermoleophilia bacterium]